MHVTYSPRVYSSTELCFKQMMIEEHNNVYFRHLYVCSTVSREREREREGEDCKNELVVILTCIRGMVPLSIATFVVFSLVVLTILRHK